MTIKRLLTEKDGLGFVKNELYQSKFITCNSALLNQPIQACHERYCSWWIMRIKSCVYHLSPDCHLHIDCDISNAHCRSSSGDSVDLLGETIFTTMVVHD